MISEDLVSQHYSHGGLLEAIKVALIQQGNVMDRLTLADLSAVDEFHVGGRMATEHLLSQVNFAADQEILDVGCGLGGTARYTANKFNNRVTGIDLSAEYIETGKHLCQWVGLDKQVTLHHGSALSMPFEDKKFDGATLCHVGMNIQDKAGLFNEIYRVLKPGSRFAIYDIMLAGSGELIYPLPWATDVSCSYLSSLDEYQLTLTQAGFSVLHVNNRRDFALEFFTALTHRNLTKGGVAPLSLHTVMGTNSGDKINNMLKKIRDNVIAPIELFVHKL